MIARGLVHKTPQKPTCVYNKIMARGQQGTSASATARAPKRGKIAPLGARRLLPSPQELQELFAYRDKTGIVAVVNKAEYCGSEASPGRQSFVEGDFELDGEKVGEWQRWFTQEIIPDHVDSTGYPMVDHDGKQVPVRLVAKSSWLQVVPEQQGKGLGQRYVDHTENVYRKMGVDRVEVWSTHVGAYAWAKDSRYHFDTCRPYAPDRFENLDVSYAEAREAAKILWSRGSSEKIEKMLANKQITPLQLEQYKTKFLSEEEAREHYSAFLDAPKDLADREVAKTPFDILQIGRDNVWTTEHGPSWFGKELLLEMDSGWEGYRKLV